MEQLFDYLCESQFVCVYSEFEFFNDLISEILFVSDA